MVAPGDAEEACYWSGRALNLAWKHQIPAVILSDKTLSEGTYTFDPAAVPELPEEAPLLWDGKGDYRRYRITESGVSPLCLPLRKGAVVKVNSYEHDEAGLTTEEAQVIDKMQLKRLRKGAALREDLKAGPLVRIDGPADSRVALVCWGSTAGACREAARARNLRVIQPLVLSPFPDEELRRAAGGAERLICVENNATGQMERLLNCAGVRVDESILKYDGRPFAVDELENRLQTLLEA